MSATNNFMETFLSQTCDEFYQFLVEEQEGKISISTFSVYLINKICSKYNQYLTNAIKTDDEAKKKLLGFIETYDLFMKKHFNFEGSVFASYQDKMEEHESA